MKGSKLRDDISKQYLRLAFSEHQDYIIALLEAHGVEAKGEVNFEAINNIVKTIVTEANQGRAEYDLAPITGFDSKGNIA